MRECNFTGADYTRDKDRLVDNIRVVAQRPFLSSSGNAMGNAGRVKSGSAAAAAAIRTEASLAEICHNWLVYGRGLMLTMRRLALGRWRDPQYTERSKVGGMIGQRSEV
ncbi:uncharacterized protein ColSpa_11683 [Colletotrichum spaethianum]|uniref:Uncharacterized protein n=1 Tax=Colletotrichum spaethianum TaxID=700344 RepID=A0AA37PFX9_9PEZI|nr:uncharacterized protein ColSpa_11683 [Colletotrichum spaethianum]GKT51502.1 hypothetical protein ColSpa_11683 [Colletotrichum spaethianum]